MSDHIDETDYYKLESEGSRARQNNFATAADPAETGIDLEKTSGKAVSGEVASGALSGEASSGTISGGVKPTDGVEELPELSPEQYSEAVAAIGELAMAYDDESIDSIIANLGQFRLPVEKAADFSEIKKAARKLDWTKLQELCIAK